MFSDLSKKGQFNNEFSNLPFIHINHDIIVSRIYKKDKMLFCMTACLDEMIPLGSDSIYEMSKYVMGLLEPCKSPINLLFGYPEGSLTKKQKNKLEALLREREIDQKVLIRYITLLSVISKG